MKTVSDQLLRFLGVLLAVLLVGCEGEWVFDYDATLADPRNNRDRARLRDFLEIDERFIPTNVVIKDERMFVSFRGYRKPMELEAPQEGEVYEIKHPLDENIQLKIRIVEDGDVGLAFDRVGTRSYFLVYARKAG